jgi:photosystem II stability/assembly factor-like uncharacterized protein
MYTTRTRCRILCALLMLLAGSASAQPQWQHVGGPTLRRIAQLVSSGDMLYAGAADLGIFASSDGGDSWRRMPNTEGYAIKYLSVAGSTLFAVAQHFIVSTDGFTWQRATGVLFQPKRVVSYAGRFHAASLMTGLTSSVDGLAWTAGTLPDEHAYDVHVEDSVMVVGAMSGIYRSTDTARTWTQVLAKTYCMQLVRTPSQLCVAAGPIYSSTDLGQTWTNITYNMQGPVQNISNVGDTLIVVQPYEGMHRLVPGDTVWRPVSAVGPCYIFTLHQAHKGRMFYAAGNGLWRSGDAGATWSNCTPPGRSSIIKDVLVDGPAMHVASPTGLFQRQAPNDAWRLADHDGFLCSGTYALQQAGDTIWAFTNKALLRSTDRGRTWSGISPRNVGGRAFAVVGDTIILSSSILHRSTDGGSSWTQPSIPDSARAIIDVIRHHRGMWFAAAGQEGSLYRSTDGGAHWHTIAPTPQIYAMMDSDDSLLYAASYSGRFYRTSDAGESWQAVPLAGGPSRITAITVHGGSVFVRTETRIDRKPHADSTWTSLPHDPAIASGTLLRVQAGFLHAGTDSNGVWRLPLEQVVGVAPAEARVPSHPRIHGIAPHPVGDRLTADIEIQNSDVVDVDVWDALGRHVAGMRQWVGAGTRHRVSLALPRTPSGIHLLRIRTAHGAATRPFIVQ